MVPSQCPMCQYGWLWTAAVRMPRTTPESSSRCFCSKMAATASSSTTLQLSDGCQPDNIVPIAMKSEDLKKPRSISQRSRFSDKARAFEGPLCLWLHHGPLFVVRGTRQQYVQLDLFLAPQGALRGLAFIRTQFVAMDVPYA